MGQSPSAEELQERQDWRERRLHERRRNRARPPVIALPEKVEPSPEEVLDLQQRTHNARLSILPLRRIAYAAAVGFGVGMPLGAAQGSLMAGLRFRAEHAHKLPLTAEGWYRYHKSKKYTQSRAGFAEGARLGTQLGLMAAALFWTENLIDVYRGTKDMLSTVLASLSVAGGFSLINQLPAPSTARTIRKGLKFGFAYGALQDVVSVARGRHVGYVEFVRKHLGYSSHTIVQDEHAV